MRGLGVMRIRFHGRGGQGMKTASRIVGTTAVLDGLAAQDSPVYGAERRGAPMTAFVRIGRGPILERGTIPTPALVVVADDTLLDDPAVAPLAGLPPTGILLIATVRAVDDVRRMTEHPGPIVARDFVALALEQVGSAAGGSTALAAAACALLGLSASAVAHAVTGELAAIGLSPRAIRANLRLAERARTGLAPIELRAFAGSPHAVGALVDVAYVAPELGTPSVAAAPNTPLRHTGNWRVFRPVIELGKCTRCWICFVRCPDGAIALDAADVPQIAYDVCKGCLICVEECPTHTITAVREGRAAVAAEVGP